VSNRKSKANGGKFYKTFLKGYIVAKDFDISKGTFS